MSYGPNTLPAADTLAANAPIAGRIHGEIEHLIAHCLVPASGWQRHPGVYGIIDAVTRRVLDMIAAARDDGTLDGMLDTYRAHLAAHECGKPGEHGGADCNLPPGHLIYGVDHAQSSDPEGSMTARNPHYIPARPATP